MLANVMLRAIYVSLVIISSCEVLKARPTIENAMDKIARIDARYKESTDSRHEVDMILPPKVTRNRRSLKKTEHYQTVKLWPHGVIPYTISNELLKEKGLHSKLVDAMDEWQSKTCITFKPRTKEIHYVHFYKGRGCMADVGIKSIGRQTISLGKDCDDRKIIIHELGHTIGLYHEQNRPDRNRYIKVLYENIRPSFHFAYDVKSGWHPDSVKTPYDYYSVMHYGNKDFSHYGRVTMRAFKPGVQYFGAKQVSGLDAIRVRKMYKCKEYPKFPRDFFFSYFNYGLRRKTCIDIIEPDDSSNSWNDNQLCYNNHNKRPLDIKWSYRGPVPGMECTQVSYFRKSTNPSWNDNYICVPKYAPYKFKWVNGRIPWKERRANCVKIYEPRDRQWSKDHHYLCATQRETDPVDGKWTEWSDWGQCSLNCGGGFQFRQRHCSFPANGGKSCQGEKSQHRRCNTQACNDIPSFPEDFSFVHTEPFTIPKSGICLRTYNLQDYMAWVDYFFCSSQAKSNPNITWSYMGPVNGMRCTNIHNPLDFNWPNNIYICAPRPSPYRLKWSISGPIPGMACLRWYAKQGKKGWDKTYLCNARQSSSMEALH